MSERLVCRAAVATVACLAAALACTSRTATPTPAPLPIAHRIGFVDGGCLVIDDGALPISSPITMVMLDERHTIARATVIGQATTGEECAPLRPDRRASNATNGMAFYKVSASDGGRPIDSAIAVVGAAARVGDGLDVNGDGQAERFTECTTSEGISYAVWSGPAYQGEPLWRGYYYLGFDTEPNCPAAGDEK